MARRQIPLGEWGDVYYLPAQGGGWRARAKVRDFDGAVRIAQRSGRSKAAAKRELVAHLRERYRAHAADSELTPVTTLADLAAAWIAELRRQGKPSEQSIMKYQSTISRHITPSIGKLTIEQVSTGRMERYLATIESVSVHKWARRILNGMLGMAARHDVIRLNPIADTSTRSSGATTPEALTPGQVQQLRLNVNEWVGSNDMGPPRGGDLPEFVDVLLGTGLRIGEALGLRWEDVDLKEEKLTVVGTVVTPDKGPLRWQNYPKSDAGKRTVLLPTFVLEALRRLSEKAAEDEQIFPSARGGWRSPNNVRRQLREARGEHLSWVTPHTLRRTAATTIARSAGLAAAQAQLGHSSQSITERHYVQRVTQAGDHRADLGNLIVQLGDF